jgi:PleD family two-component response regulator
MKTWQKKIQSYSRFGDRREEIDSLVLQLSTICNQACEELVIEYNNIKNKKLMKNEKNKTVLVDDDAVFLKSLEIEFLQHTDFIVETYATMFSEFSRKKPDVIILDYHLDGIDKMR